MRIPDWPNKSHPVSGKTRNAEGSSHDAALDGIRPDCRNGLDRWHGRSLITCPEYLVRATFSCLLSACLSALPRCLPSACEVASKWGCAAFQPIGLGSLEASIAAEWSYRGSDAGPSPLVLRPPRGPGWLTPFEPSDPPARQIIGSRLRRRAGLSGG
jgi:hypothetical protein